MHAKQSLGCGLLCSAAGEGFHLLFNGMRVREVGGIAEVLGQDLPVERTKPHVCCRMHVSPAYYDIKATRFSPHVPKQCGKGLGQGRGYQPYGSWRKYGCDQAQEEPQQQSVAQLVVHQTDAVWWAPKLDPTGRAVKALRPSIVSRGAPSV